MLAVARLTSCRTGRTIRMIFELDGLGAPVNRSVRHPEIGTTEQLNKRRIGFRLASMQGEMMKLLCEVRGVRYELFDMHALDEMAVMVAEAFTRYESIAVVQDFPLEEFVDFVKLLGPKAEQEELTVLAREQETG
jgi:hypothetical protein